jgi:hypothetical protein
MAWRSAHLRKHAGFTRSRTLNYGKCFGIEIGLVLSHPLFAFGEVVNEVLGSTSYVRGVVRLGELYWNKSEEY